MVYVITVDLYNYVLKRRGRGRTEIVTSYVGHQIYLMHLLSVGSTGRQNTIEPERKETGSSNVGFFEVIKSERLYEFLSTRH